MTAAAQRRRFGPDTRRRALYAKIAVARKQLALAEDTYRDMLADRYGAASAAELTYTEIDDLLAHFKHLGFKPTRKAGRRTVAGSPEAAKARALWISLYHLGVVRDASERALSAFGERQTGKAALQWIRGDWFKVIEALKDWAARPLDRGGAGVDWSSIPGIGDNPRARVLEAQWRRLAALGWAKVDSTFALAGWLQAAGFTAGREDQAQLDPETADRAIAHLGRIIRARLQTAKETQT